MSKKNHIIKPLPTELDSKTDKLISPTYGKITIEEMLKLILDYYEKTKDNEGDFEIIIGTDSQTFATYTKIVPCVVARRCGKGAIYFYKLHYIEKTPDVRKKLNLETQLSLLYANTVLELLESNEEYEDLYLESNFAIHVDAGNSDKGKTKDLIPSIVGWIKGSVNEDINVCVKPDSWSASSVADYLSK